MTGGANQKKKELQRLAPVFLNRLARVLFPSEQSLLASLPEFRHAYNLHEVNCATTLAKKRMDILYTKIYTLPIEIRSHACWWIDCHVPLVQSGETSVRMAYSKHLMPEQQYGFPVYPICGVVNDVWIKSIASCEHEPGSSNSLAIKLLKKGSASPPSIRYISAQIERCANVAGESEYTVRTLILLHMLGSYPNRKIVMNPRKRLELYSKPTTQLFKLISTWSSKDMYCIVATFLVWCTKQCAPLWKYCIEHHGLFIKAILMANMEYTQKVTLDVCKRCNDWGTQSTFDLFVSALDIKKKIPVWVQQEITNGATIKTCWQIGSHVSKLTVAVLLHVGIKNASVQHLIKCVSTRTEAALILKGISRKERAILYTLLLAMITANDFKVRHFCNVVMEKQREACLRVHGNATYYGTICVACSTWRPKSRYVQGISKATCGVLLNFKSDVVACNACGSDWSVRPINMVGRFVRCRLRLGSLPFDVALCVMCAHVTSPVKFLGIFPYCEKCYRKVYEQIHIPATCVTCNKDIKPGGGKMFDCVRSPSKIRSVAAVCNKHIRCLEAKTGIQDYDALQKLKSKYQTVYKRVGNFFK